MQEYCTQTWDNKTDGGIRFIVDASGIHWFVAKDLAKYLNWHNAALIVARVEQLDKQKVLIRDGGRKKPMDVVSECGLHALVVRTRNKTAMMYKRWLTHTLIREAVPQEKAINASLAALKKPQ